MPTPAPWEGCSAAERVEGDTRGRGKTVFLRMPGHATGHWRARRASTPTLDRWPEDRAHHLRGDDGAESQPGRRGKGRVTPRTPPRGRPVKPWEPVGGGCRHRGGERRVRWLPGRSGCRRIGRDALVSFSWQSSFIYFVHLLFVAQ